MISIILTAANEPNTIGKAISCLVDPEYSGYRDKYELILVCPDEPTYAAAMQTLNKIHCQNFVYIKDQGRGKPAALNQAIAKAKGEFLVFSDGDVYLKEGTVKELINNLQIFPEIGGISGRQYSSDNRNNMFGYYSHLFAEALNIVRSQMLAGNPRNFFFPMSGYVMAVRAALIDFILPEDVLVDDGYISYKIYNKGYTIGYSNKAAAFVSYPKNSEDYFKQKIRSTGGYLQLKKYGIVSAGNNRGPTQDLKLILFPLQFAKNLKELCWSLLLYLLRFNLWLRIFAIKVINPNILTKSWKRVESTK